VPVCELRSSSQGLLCVHRTRTVLALRAFTHSATTICNNLHADIRNSSSIESFCSSLMTAIFHKVFATQLSYLRLRIACYIWRVTKLIIIMMNQIFLQNPAVTLDALEELSDLSDALQNGDITLAKSVVKSSGRSKFSAAANIIPVASTWKL
jgi:hypothetical protein